MMIKSFYLALACSFVVSLSCGQIQEEKQLTKTIDVFAKNNWKKWNDFAKLMEPSGGSTATSRFETFNSSPFIQAFNTFTQENASHYAAVRSAKFTQYAPPPPALLALTWDTSGMNTPGSVSKHMDLFSVVFLRTFDPAAIGQVTNSLTVNSLFSDSASRDKMVAYYRKRDLFGMRVYVRPLTGNNWQIWVADRTLAISFRFDIAKGIVSDVSHTKINDPAYAKIQWIHSVAKPLNATVRLMDEIMYQIWNTYPANGFDSETYYAYREVRTEKIVNFMRSQSARYKTARELQLRSLEQPPAQLTNYKELTTAEDNLLADADSAYNAATILYPEQWSQIIGIAAVRYFGISTQTFSRRVQGNAILGAGTYARRLNDNEWEVWTVGGRDATSCIWNIRTGYIRKARYWVLNEEGA